MQVDRPVASGGSVPNLESSRARPSRRTADHSSPLRQPTPSPQRMLERPSSSSKRRHRANPGTTEEDTPSPTKRSAYTKSAATGSPVLSPSRSRATTPRRIEPDLTPPNGIGKALRKSPRQSAKVSPLKSKGKGGGTRSESIFAEHYPPLSSLTVDTSMDREEGPSRRTSRRSAASKATQRLRDEVMPDVVNFEKELKRGNVRAVDPQKREDALKPSGKGKKRASIQFRLEGGGSSDGEHERKKRRLSGAKVSDRSKELDDDGRTDITGTSSQGSAHPSSGKGGAKGVKAKKPSSGRDPRHVELVPHDTFRWLTGPQRQARGDLGHASHSGRRRGKGKAGKVYECGGSFVHRFCLGQALAKLGARVGVKPDECTHLVVKTLARTEKLLCAMAVAPAVVTEKWVRDSIAAKKLLRGWILSFLFYHTYSTNFFVSYRQVRTQRPGEREKVGFQARRRIEACQGEERPTFLWHRLPCHEQSSGRQKAAEECHIGERRAGERRLVIPTPFKSIDDGFWPIVTPTKPYGPRVEWQGDDRPSTLCDLMSRGCLDMAANRRSWPPDILS